MGSLERAMGDAVAERAMMRLRGAGTGDGEASRLRARAMVKLREAGDE
jgi:hypothetical protein